MEKHLSAFRGILDAARNLDTLDICLDASAFATSTPALRKLKPAEHGEIIVNALLGHGRDSTSLELHPAKRRSLSTLRLRWLDLARAAKCIVEAIQPSSLINLSFQLCDHEVSVLSEMTKYCDAATQERIQIRRLKLIQSRTISGNAIQENFIDDFLSKFGTLESLVIHGLMTDALWPSLESIVKHKDGLRTLYLDFAHSGEPWCYPESDMDVFLTQCQRIEQLALNVPGMDYDPQAEVNDTICICFVSVLTSSPSQLLTQASRKQSASCAA